MLIAHTVICPYCSKTFDRDTEEYAKINKRRYAHASCALAAKAKNPKLPQPVIINPLDEVVCIYCNQPFNKSTTPHVMVRNGQYAHTECAELEEKRDKTDAELLDEYILNLFDLEYVPPRIQRQIASFINDYNFTHSGILKTLRYFYEVKRQDVKKANEGIGIVPWIYKEAYAYYKRMWDAVEKNKDKNINLYQPKVEEVHVVPPEREAMRRKKRFRFLETDEVDEDAI